MLDEAITQVPDPQRRDLLITVDGAGATLDLINHITALNTVHGRRGHYSVGFDLDARARAAITGDAFQRAALPRSPRRPFGRCDAIDSAAAYTSTCRRHDVTGFRHPQAEAGDNDDAGCYIPVSRHHASAQDAASLSQRPVAGVHAAGLANRGERDTTSNSSSVCVRVTWELPLGGADVACGGRAAHQKPTRSRWS